MSLYFNTLADFVAMGGHGFYIWLAYTIVILALVLQAVYFRWLLPHSKQKLSAYYKRLDARKKQ